MSAEREELHQLIQDLPEEEVPVVFGALWPRLRAGKNRAWLPASFGAAQGHTSDAAAWTEERLQGRFGQI
jgi:hypothetical protein